MSALMLRLHVTNDVDTKPLFYIDNDGFPFNVNGEDLSIQVCAAGLAHLRNAD